MVRRLSRIQSISEAVSRLRILGCTCSVRYPKRI